MVQQELAQIDFFKLSSALSRLEFRKVMAFMCAVLRPEHERYARSVIPRTGQSTHHDCPS
jgi:hypothetical protein